MCASARWRGGRQSEPGVAWSSGVLDGIQWLYRLPVDPLTTLFLDLGDMVSVSTLKILISLCELRSHAAQT